VETKLLQIDTTATRQFKNYDTFMQIDSINKN